MKSDYADRRWIFSAAVLLIFGLLVFRIFVLQVYFGDKYLQKSERNRIRMIPVKPTRGLFVDRNRNVVVDNRAAYSVSVIPYEVEEKDSVFDILATILNISKQDIIKKVGEKKVGSFFPVKIKRHIEFNQLAQLEEHRLDLPGVIIEFEPQRRYPIGPLAPHAFGYLGEITSDELTAQSNYNYSMGDFIGKNGLEKKFEETLRGTKGIMYVEVDVLGRELGTAANLTPKSAQEGHNLEITLDIALQNHLSEAMEGKRGAAVVLDCHNGEVLALVSKPSFDLNVFTSIIKPDDWQNLVSNPQKPLFDRTVQGVFPPGSTYKLILATAALETAIINQEQEYECSGSMRLGRRTFDCWKEEGHGRVNLIEALAQSCNVYFYNLSLEVGLDAWSSFGKYFGFGTVTGIDMPGENAGLVPDKNILDERYGVGQWTRGMLLNLAVGQGDLLVTPIQMAQFTMAIANNGVYYTPHLVRAKINPNDSTKIYTQIETKFVPNVRQTTYDILKEGMFRVVNSESGTGRAAYLQQIPVAGKTGTAQNPHGDDHAWFIGYAPVQNPSIVFCIFVENGGGGGAIAAPIAGSFLKMYFNNKKTYNFLGEN